MVTDSTNAIIFIFLATYTLFQASEAFVKATQLKAVITLTVSFALYKTSFTEG